MSSLPCRFGLVVSLAAITAAPAASTTRHVFPDGSGPYPTIQAAISASVDGDEVVLAPGTYRGSGNRSIDCSSLEISIHSEGNDPETCILDCEMLGNGLRLDSATGPGCVIEGLTIANGLANTGGAINLLHQASPTIRHCRFVSCSAGSDGGAIGCLESSPLITDCVFLRCHAEVFGGALNVQTFSSPRLEHCLIELCSASYGGGVELWDHATLTVARCTFVQNHAEAAGGALECFADSHLQVDHCTIVGNTGHGSGMACPGGTPSTFSISHSIVAFGEYPAVYCSQGDPYVLTCCDIFGNGMLDWLPCVADQLGVNGNLHEDPLLCLLQNPESPYGLNAESPCAPESNPECGLMGAWPVACDVSDVPGGSVSPDVRSGRLVRCEPSPMRDWTRITYILSDAPRDAAVRLAICDAAGRVIRDLCGESDGRPAGSASAPGSVVWDGRDESGRKVASGVYYVRLEGAGQRASRPLVVTR